MIQVAPQAQVELAHSAAYLAVCGEGHIAAISRSGSGTFFAPNLTSPKRFSVPASIHFAELSQDGGELAVTASNGITTYSTVTFEQTGYLNDAFESCLFASPGLFWTCAQFGKATKVVEVRDAKTKTRIAHRKVADPFAEGVFILYQHPSQNSAVILAGAGQDGQRVYWATLDRDTIQVKRFEDLHFTSRPAFSPNGREFLVTDEERVARYSYPNGPLLGEMDELAGDSVGYSDGVYLDERRVLLTSAEGRLFVVDAEDMEVVDDLSILGFEELPMSPFQGFLGLSENKFLSIHGDPGAEMGDNWVHLAVWSVPPA
jgi:hypothetical protein